MSISPPSDILLDSLRGVDPSVRNASIEKLKQYGKTVITPASGETSFKNQLANTHVSGMPFHASSALTEMRNEALLRQKPDTPAKTALRQFEGAFLKNFIETMQPNKTASLYGSGTAGSVWQSFMSDAVAKKVSEAGGVGIAKSLESQFAPQAAAAPAPSKWNAASTTPSPTVTEAEPESDFFSSFRNFFSNIHSLFNSLLPSSSQASRRDEFSLTLR